MSSAWAPEGDGKTDGAHKTIANRLPFTRFSKGLWSKRLRMLRVLSGKGHIMDLLLGHINHFSGLP